MHTITGTGTAKIKLQIHGKPSSMQTNLPFFTECGIAASTDSVSRLTPCLLLCSTGMGTLSY